MERGGRREGGTYELDAPPEDGGAEVLGVVERAALEDLDGVDDGHAAVELPAGDVVVQVLWGGGWLVGVGRKGRG